MAFYSNALSHKRLGFYIAGTASILAFITAIVYQITYSSNQYYSSNVFFALLVVLPVTVVLLLLKLDGFIPAATTLLIGIAAALFIYAMYFEVSVVLVGIDKSSFDPQFIACCILIAAGFLLGEISIYTN